MIASSELNLSLLPPEQARYINDIRNWQQWMALQILQGDVIHPTARAFLNALSTKQTEVGREQRVSLYDGLFHFLVFNVYTSSKTDRGIFNNVIDSTDQAMLIQNTTLPDERFQAAVDAYFLQQIIIRRLFSNYYSIDSTDIFSMPILPAQFAIDSMHLIRQSIIDGGNLLTPGTATELSENMLHIKISSDRDEQEIDLTSTEAVKQMKEDINMAFDQLSATGIQRLRLGRYICSLSDNIHTQVFGTNAEIEFFSCRYRYY